MTVGVSIEGRPNPADSAEAGEPGRSGLIPDSIRRRLEPMPAWQWRSWAAAGWVVAIAAILRFVHLSFPPTVVFDEVYYAAEGQELLDHMVEWRTETDSAGNILGSHADFVVHPPLGKWIIALGIQLFGNNSFGWRFAAAVVGTLSVLILTRLGRRMFRSTVLGCVAGLLMALDGLHLVLSRTAILDIFVLFFVLISFTCLVLDRDARRLRWLRAMEAGLDPSVEGRAGRPRLTWSGVPWWRLAAGLALGAACSVKWSGIFFLPVFLLLILLWEVGLRRTVGVKHPWRDTLLDETGWIAGLMALIGLAYLSSWTGWFMSDDGWKRHYLRDELGKSEWPIVGPLYNLWAYHMDVFHFHEGLTSPHTYQSWPWQWLLLGRPVA
ncbi:MAG TPA: phospholipid carrier-dependent glycosyltransferase, partial [Micromonosporaceae bacterium]